VCCVTIKNEKAIISSIFIFSSSVAATETNQGETIGLGLLFEFSNIPK